VISILPKVFGTSCTMMREFYAPTTRSRKTDCSMPYALSMQENNAKYMDDLSPFATPSKSSAFCSPQA
jgi:hypothetical protein